MCFKMSSQSCELESGLPNQKFLEKQLCWASNNQVFSFPSEQVAGGDAREPASAERMRGRAAALTQTLRLRATVIKSSGSRWL